MSRYRLRLKGNATIDLLESKKYNVAKSNPSNRYLMMYSCGYRLCGHNSVFYNSIDSSFNEEEMDLIPNGLFKKFDIIEIKEDKYNIICPITSHHLVIDKLDDSVAWINTPFDSDNDGFKKQFTRLEIENRFKCYANETFMIKNNSK